MATVSPSSFSPGNTAGYREDLSKLAPRMIDPADAPVYKGAKKVKATALLHEWLTDALPSNTIPTPAVYGTEPTYTTTLARSRAGNRVQQFRTTWSVSEVSELIAKVGGIGGGIASEVTREIERQLKSMSRQIERTLLSAQAVGTDDGSGTAASLGGFFSKVTTNVTATGATATDAYVGETELQAKIKALFDAGSGGDMWLVAPSIFCSKVGTSFNGRNSARETTARGDHKVDTLVEKYIAPVGGEVMIEPNRSMGDGIAIINRDHIAVAELSPISVYERDPNTFENRQGRISTYLTLEYGNEKSHGGWYSDTTPDAAGE